MMLDATQRYTLPLTEKRLFGWHAALFPTGYSGPYAIEVGRYRTAKMQVVSGAIGKEKVHYEAVKPELVKTEMDKFLDWKLHEHTSINERQRIILNKLFDDFEGKLQTSKWAKIVKTSTDTALRDIKDLVEKGILKQTDEGGRNANYELVNLNL